MNDLECPYCGGHIETQRCTNCGEVFQTVLGVPFFGDFESDDILGLIEIAAAAPRRANLRIPADYVEKLDALVRGYHEAADKRDFQKQNTDAAAPHFENRYNEWLQLQTLMEGADLNGKKVLDIGAGQGVDSQRLSLAGADVTALEFSPLLAEAGSLSFPHFRWIGGFGHALPFKTASFDAVFCNAALHHMRDIPATISEALRVLRPGGILITSSDPFRPSKSAQHLELEIFDKHPEVLLGVNEQIPVFSDFVEHAEHAEIVSTDLYTQVLYGGISGSDEDVLSMTHWDLELHGNALHERSGSIAMRMRLKQSWPLERRMLKKGVISASDYADLLDDQSLAMAELSRFVPKSYVDQEFPGRPNKFDLLNGWRLERPTRKSRVAYKRARRFVTASRADVLSFQVTSPVPSEFALLIDGEEAAVFSADQTKKQVRQPIAGPLKTKTVSIEIQKQSNNESFDHSCFTVSDFSMSRQSSPKSARSTFARLFGLR